MTSSSIGPILKTIPNSLWTWLLLISEACQRGLGLIAMEFETHGFLPKQKTWYWGTQMPMHPNTPIYQSTQHTAMWTNILLIKPLPNFVCPHGKPHLTYFSWNNNKTFRRPSQTCTRHTKGGKLPPSATPNTDIHRNSPTKLRKVWERCVSDGDHVTTESSKFRVNVPKKNFTGLWTLVGAMARPLEHLVLFSVVATDNKDEGEESLIVQLAWEIVSISKIQVGFK